MKLAEELGMSYIETSAKKDISSVAQAINDLTRPVVKLLAERPIKQAADAERKKQAKVDHLIAVYEKAKPLLPSDVSTIRELLHAGCGVVTG
jgi:hypothetical protein